MAGSRAACLQHRLLVRANRKRLRPMATTTAMDNGHGNGNGGQPATEKQRSYIEQLARQIRGLGARRLDNLANKMFSKPAAEVTSFEASALIDTLKAIKSGEIKLDDAVSGAPS